MDYFQGVVTEYLRASRSVFVNTECLINLDEGDKQHKGRHWYCDAVAVNFKNTTVYLCEVTYSTTMHSLLMRLNRWEANWKELTQAVFRDSGVPNTWSVRPWVFIPQLHHDTFTKKRTLAQQGIEKTVQMPSPRITYLESIVPWKYQTWDRKTDAVVGDASQETR